MKNQKVFDPLIAVRYGEVKITDAVLLGKLKTIGEFYLSIPTSDAFYEMRTKAGLDTCGGKSLVYGRSWFEEGGIVLGQWLQAFCRFYEYTGDVRYRDRVREYVDAFAQVQKVIPSCFICETAYMAEKVFHGLLDAYEICGFADAYDVCKALMDNFRQIPEITNAACRLGDNGAKDETFREIEWYTLSEAVYRFADAAIDLSEPEEYIAQIEAFAKKFEYDQFWNIFLEEKNLFDYSPEAGVNSEYFHAYSHVNSFNSAAYLYYRTGDRKYLEAAKKFSAFMTDTQVIATGGYGTILEWLLPKDRIVDALLHCHCTFENQCNTYATLRQNRFLTVATGNIAYGNTSELLYYNSFLASLETDPEGHAYYYSDYCADGGKKWLNPISWTCCSGTRPLAAMELLRNIYFRGRDDSLYINLLIDSRIECKEAVICVEGDFIKDGKVTVRYCPKSGAKEGQTVHIRKPAYLTADPVINGKTVTLQDGMYHITFDAAGEQAVTLEFELPVYEKDISDGTQGVRAFLHGPLVLAAKGIAKRPTVTAKDLIAVGDGTFRAGDELFKPFVDYEQDEEYRMHFELEVTV